jgi:hypothetical protein
VQTIGRQDLWEKDHWATDVWAKDDWETKQDDWATPRLQYCIFGGGVQTVVKDLNIGLHGIGNDELLFTLT